MRGPTAAPIQLQTFGAVDLRNRRESIGPPAAQPKRMALLAYLAVESTSGFLRRDRIIALLWPEIDQQNARHALSQALSDLRKGLGENPFLTQGNEGLRIDPTLLWCDAVEFSAAFADGEYAEAIGHYHGAFLAGFHLSDTPGFERWLDQKQRQFRDQAAEAAVTLAQEAMRAGKEKRASRWARRAAAIVPYDEATLRELIRILVGLGDRAGAVELFEAFRRNLGADFSAVPSDQTLELVQAVRGSAPPGEASPPVESTAFRPEDRGLGHASPDKGATKRIVRHPKSPAIGRMAAMLSGGVVLVAAGWGAWTLGRDDERAPGSEVLDIVVAPFTVHGDTSLHFLREGMVDLLSSKLNATRAYRAVTPSALLSLMDRESLIPDAMGRARLREAFDADGLITGSVIAVGDKLRLTATLTRSEGAEPIGDAAVEGVIDELFVLVDNLAAALLVNRTDPDVRLSQAAALTTDSLRALVAFLEGESAYRRGAFGRAREYLGEAIEIDSAFALAHYRMATTSHWVGTTKATFDAIEAARRHGHRLSDHDRHLVEAFYLLLTGAAAEADAAYEAIIARHGDDPEAWYQFADNAFHYGPLRGRPVSESERGFRRVLALSPNDFNAILHLARVLTANGDLAALDSLIRQKYPDGVPWTLRALRGFGFGDQGEMDAVTDWLTDTNHPDMFV